MSLSPLTLSTVLIIAAATVAVLGLFGAIDGVSAGWLACIGVLLLAVERRL